MPNLTTPTQLTLLPWDKPMVDQVVDWLVAEQGWGGGAPLDLSSLMIVVPTRQSGRRLREALAAMAESHDQAVLAPLVTVPEGVPGLVADRPPTASREQMLLAWMRVLLEASPHEYRVVFPVEPPQRNAEWARRLAERLLKVQSELATGGLGMSDVARQPDLPESIRWRELAELEVALERVLTEMNVVSPTQADRDGLDGVQPPAGVKRIILAGCPDPNPIALRYLSALVSVVPVEVLAYGPAGEASADLFDSWGRPRTEHWSNRPVGLSDFESQVRLAADPGHQARQIAKLAESEPDPEEWLALAVADPEVTPALARELEDKGMNVFLPEGESWKRGSMFGLLQALGELVQSTDAQSIGNVLRCPAVMAAIDDRVEGGYPADLLLRHWDRVLEIHLPRDLAAAQAHADSFPKLVEALKLIGQWVEQLRQRSFAEAARAVPAQIFEGRMLVTDSEEAMGARRWMEAVSRVEQALGMMPGLPTFEAWRLALSAYSEGARFGPRMADAVELTGWLEVLWADAPRLVVAGANEGLLPESIGGDAFLPEGMRQLLRLKTNEERMAVDAYLMAAAVASRPQPEDVLILVGKTSMAGDPLRPSRILMAGDDQTLPERVHHLFSPMQEVVDNMPWQRAWRLRPRRVRLKSSLAVTGLRDWLDCPFRFYLNRGLGMQEVDLPKTELNALDFGSLVHDVLEHMGKDRDLSSTQDEGLLREGLLADFERRVGRRFGDEPAVPLLIQFESARQRLRRVATVECQERMEGWRAERVEWEFSVPLGGLTIVGKIDRIDRHEDGRIRVIDYKTSDRAADPLAKHLAPLREADHQRPDWLKVIHGGKERRWVDLQLPLYRLALAEEFGRDLTCAYFNLPKAISETGLWYWEDEDGQLQAAAEACAQGVTEAIVAGDFWPPIDHLAAHDDQWSSVIHRGITASVDESWIQQEVGDV